jgi:hypothetical protein
MRKHFLSGVILPFDAGYNTKGKCKRDLLQLLQRSSPMPLRIPTIILFLLGLPLIGCDQPNKVELQISAPSKRIADTEKGKATDQKQDRSRPESKAISPANKNFTEKYGCKWSDAKESDFPLTLELESPPVPEDIQGPFPENAGWRSEEKSPEKKPSKGFWPWN